MKVVVIVPKWGTYKEGDEIDMPESTARACIVKGVVKDPNADDDQEDDDDFDLDHETGDQDDDQEDGEPGVIGTGSAIIVAEENQAGSQDEASEATETSPEQSEAESDVANEESTEVKPKKKK
ncbi:MAG: hypothetical protein EOO97_00395 [Pedobacter sp.]|nr:MAG: hypothetical protein EOO97_00395 [Pedobacter sp.]